MFGADRIVLSSASSKTGMGLAWMLRRRGGVEVVGLSSAANAAVIADTGCYDRLIAYGDAGKLGQDGAKTVFVDFAGDGALTRTLHGALGDDLVASIRVGGTHWEAPASTAELPGVAPRFFFAPDHARERIAEWGERGFYQRFSETLGAFVAASPWLTIVHLDGAAGMAAAWQDALSGRADPTRGMIVRA